MTTISIERFGSFFLVNFTDLTLEEKKMVLTWRNHNEIKKWMYNQNDILLDNHLMYIENLSNSIDKKYFIVKQNESYIGVVDFIQIDDKNKECEFGLYANPFEKTVGIGRILEELCIKYVFEILKFKKLKLEVFTENKQVRNLHKKYNFQEISTKKTGSKTVICMELEK